jgi:hypothetical protein
MATTLTPTPPLDADNPADLDIPPLGFDNRTDFDALHFDAIDQHNQVFHVLVAKTGYSLGTCNALGEAQLVALDEPAQLNVEDLYYEDNLACSVREESDLAPYKPNCDVIVNGAAYAPQGKAVREFKVRLHVQRPATRAALPERPEQLNPFQNISHAQSAQWKEQLASAESTRIAGEVLIDKTISITGERELRKYIWPIPWLLTLLAWCTLGLIRLNPWRLTGAKKFTSMPLRYEFAQGGQCRVEQGTKEAQRIAKKHHLTPEQIAQHPDKDAPPLAHDACETNPVGRGFARQWYLKATRIRKLPAPRTEYASAPVTTGQFWRTARGGALPQPAGLGIIGRAYLPRRLLVGKIEEKAQWGENEFPRLPKEFSHQYWNSAPVDQQCAHLAGQERITLINLSAPNAPYARADASGNSIVRFALPLQSLYVLAATQQGKVSVKNMVIDTVVIDLDAAQVHLVWRICLPADGNLTEAQLQHATQEAQLQRIALLQAPPATETGAYKRQPVTL